MNETAGSVTEIATARARPGQSLARAPDVGRKGRRGATLGPNSVILPAATIGRHSVVGPVSLVMRGESLPDKTLWIGNPIGPWAE